MNAIHSAAPLPPYPLEGELERILKDSDEAVAVVTRALYLDMAEAIVDQAVAWVDEAGIIVDPVEGHDNRWAGGTASRFACPAAVLVRERNRTDLTAAASRALTQVSEGILKRAAHGDAFPAGVLDLTMKEIVIAYDILRAYVDSATAYVWRKAISAIRTDAVYTLRKTLDEGKSLHNYGVYACTGEWLRCIHGLSGDRAWVERSLGYEMPLFTSFGMYRDPGDPMLYDLAVRHNLSELLHYGYDGEHRDRIEDLLRRAGATMLWTLSSCGYAPFGGRSNALLHNEAMAVYCGEYLAGYWWGRRRMDLASAFKEAALRAAKAAEPYVREKPIRFIKNWFDPSTRHGRDSGYGEYSNYALLAASVFARTALVADDDIPAAVSPPASHGCIVNLWPAFHKVFVTCGGSHAEIDTRCQAAYDATGLGRLHRKGAPPDLGLSMGIAADPNYIVSGASSGRAAAVGPCWRTRAGAWQSLAQMSEEIEDITVQEIKVSPNAVAWRITWSFGSASRIPVPSIVQNYRLTEGRLDIDIRAQGVFDRLGLEVPCLVTDGDAEAGTEVSKQNVTVRFRGWVLRAEVREASDCILEDTIRANRHARYRVARFEVAQPAIKASLSISHL